MNLYEALTNKFGSIDNIYREERNFSISRSHLYRIINGEISPKVRMVEQLAILLDQPFVDVVKYFVIKDEDQLE